MCVFCKAFILRRPHKALGRESQSEGHGAAAGVAGHRQKPLVFSMLCFADLYNSMLAA